MKRRATGLSFLWLVLATILLLAIYSAVVGVATTYVSALSTRLAIVLPSLALLLAIFGSWAGAVYALRRRRQNIIKSFDVFAEDHIASSGLGVIMYDEHGEIFWTSKFLQPKLVDRSLIGKKLGMISPDFNTKFLSGKTLFHFDLEGLVFEARVYPDDRIIVLKDVTNENLLFKQYMAEKYVLGEVEIDNYQQLQVILPEEALFKLQTTVFHMLDELAEKYNMSYRQYVNGKYLLITNKEVLDQLIATNFDFLDKLREQRILNDMRVTISAGFGAGTSLQRELLDLAKDGLAQAQARGGDQVAVMEPNKKPQYFGSKVDTAKTTSRVRIKQIAELLEARLLDKRIRRVIIYGHAFADLDAVGAALGIYEFARAMGKEAYIQNWTFDFTTNRALSALPKADIAMFIRPSRAQLLTVKDSTLVIIVDTAEIDRIENSHALENVHLENVFVLDHHRVSKLPKGIPNQNMYIDTAASSAAEIVCEVLQFTNKVIAPSRFAAQMLLNGLYLDTKGFTKSVSARTYAVAAWLETHGAQTSEAVEMLKLPAQYESIIRATLANVREVMPGYFLASSQDEIPLDVVSIIADEILRTQDRKAAFVVAKVPGERKYKMSARGINTNVQVIAEAVGGGGHFGAAAAESSEPLPIFLDNIMQAIISSKGTSAAPSGLSASGTASATAR